MSRYLDAVDREKETALFADILEGKSTRRVMPIQADTGMGKSYLLERLLMPRCRAAQVPYARVDFRGADFSYYDVAARVQQQVCLHYPHHKACFAPFDAEVQRATQVFASQVHMGSGGEFSRTRMGNIVGGAYLEQGAQMMVQMSEAPLARPEVQMKITMAFIESLARLTTTTLCVLFLDSYEDASPATRKWLEHDVVTCVEDGGLANVAVIIAGQEVPETARPHKLERLKPEDFHHYAKNIELELPLDTILAFHAAFDGNPKLMSEYLWSCKENL